MSRITIDIDNARIDDVAKLIEEISEDIRTSQGAALEDLSKKKRWRDRLKEFCSFSKNNQKVMLKDIYDMSILLQLLTVLSEKIYDSHNSTLVAVLDDLESLQNEVQELKNFKTEIKNVLNEEIQKLKAFHNTKSSVQNRKLLDEDNQLFLISVLDYIIKLKDNRSELQLRYLDSIKKFFCKAYFDFIGDFDKEKSIDDTEQAKIFYSFVLEAIAVIYDENKENPLEKSLLEQDIFACIFDGLALSNKDKTRIKDAVINEITIYNGSINHFIEKYDVFTEVETLDFDDQYFDFCDETTDDDNIEDDIDAESNTEDFGYYCEPITDINSLEEQTLSGIIHIKAAEEKVFRGLKLHLQNTINCDGSIIFDSCVINFNETIAHPSINISAAGQLTFVNCYIRNYDKSEQFFINVAKCDNEENIIKFENCRFHNCSKFIDCGKRNVKLVKCNITHQPINFICNANYCDIIESSIDIKTKETEDYEVYYIISSENASLTNCKVISNNKEYTSALGGRLYLFRNLDLIENCLIDNTANLTRNCSERATVVNSTFEKCTNIILGGVIDNCKISDCKQVNCHSYKSICKDSLIINCENLELSTSVENCEINGCDCSSVFFTIANKSWFINCTKISLAGANDCVFEKCTNCISCHGTVENSFFHMCYDEIIFACRSIKNSIFLNCFARSRNFIEINPNENVVIDNVFFYDCSVKNAFYFSNLTLEQKAKTSPIVISNCKFLNCKTDNPNKEIIKQNKLIHKVKLNKVYDSTKKHLFERKPKYNDVDVIKVTNCMGLDKINQIDNNIVLPEIPKLPDREYITGYSVEIAEIFHEMDSNNLYPFCIK